jgi:hypothetical protein
VCQYGRMLWELLKLALKSIHAIRHCRCQSLANPHLFWVQDHGGVCELWAHSLDIQVHPSNSHSGPTFPKFGQPLSDRWCRIMAVCPNYGRILLTLRSIAKVWLTLVRSLVQDHGGVCELRAHFVGAGGGARPGGGGLLPHLHPAAPARATLQRPTQGGPPLLEVTVVRRWYTLMNQLRECSTKSLVVAMTR